MTKPNPAIEIEVATRFLAEHSMPEQDRFAFAYTISITNSSSKTVRLLSRYWLITDGNNSQQEVHGEGVVGEQPYIASGDTYEYTSGTLLATAVGTMEGSYQLVDEAGKLFDAPIPAFSLCHPGALH